MQQGTGDAAFDPYQTRFAARSAAKPTKNAGAEEEITQQLG
jgi:hypothetical protein